MRQRTDSLPRKRSGQMIALLCVSLAVFVSILALVLDGGQLLEQRRQAQIGADFAALAASVAMSQPQATFSDGQNAAWQNATANGFPNNGSQCTVTVNSPPQDGMFAGTKNYVEVVIVNHLPASFSSFFTGTNMTVTARSVAAVAPNNIGIMTLDVSSNSPFFVSGQGQVNVNNGSILINSGSSQAGHISGNASVSANLLQVVGNLFVVGNAKVKGTMNTGATATVDPYASLPIPNLATTPLQSAGKLTISTAKTLQPGMYPGGLQLNNGANVTMQPGVYVMNGGGFTVNSGANVSGNGVVIINTGTSAGPINITGGASVNLSAPTSGTYANVLLYQDRTISLTATLSGNGNMTLSGSIYLPLGTVNLSGQQSLSDNYGSLIVASLSVTGQGKINITPNSSTNGTIRIVE